MNDVKISILLAVFNGERFLEDSILSVLNQTHKNIELLIGFNGTIDNSKEITSKFKDKRIRTFDYGMDSGKAKTINKLLTESTGTWIAIQDDDDIWLPRKLEHQVQLVDEYDIIGTQILYINENEDVIGNPILANDNESILDKSLMGDNQIANTSAIFKRSKAVEVGGWDENLDGVEDFDFWLKMMTAAKCKSINLKKFLVMHRLHASSNFNTKHFDLQDILQKYN